MPSLFLRQVAFSLIRHTATLGCGYLVAKGYINESMQEQVIGGVGAAATMIWGAGQKAGNGGTALILRSFADWIDPTTPPNVAMN